MLIFHATNAMAYAAALLLSPRHYAYAVERHASFRCCHVVFAMPRHAGARYERDIAPR